MITLNTPHHIRPTYAEVSLSALQHNIKQFSSKLKQETYLMAVVKADGYGHGAVQVARAALDAGATHLGVAFLDEAALLRQHGIQAPILVLGYTPTSAIETAARLRVSVTVFSLGQMLEIAALKNCGRLSIHLKLDTGMSRLGATTPDEARAIAHLVQCCEFTVLEGVFTHFADADGLDPSFTELQFSRFMSMLKFLRDSGIQYEMAHCCNSAAIWRFPQYQLDMVRLGIGMYGFISLARNDIALPKLEKAMRVRSAISSLKQISAYEPISYNRSYVTKSNATIAVLPIGYADGLDRKLSDLGYVDIAGQAAPIVGKICMDQTMIDVSHLIDLHIGDQAVLFGTDENGVTASDWARWLNTIEYEIVCSISKRVPRIYTNCI